MKSINALIIETAALFTVVSIVFAVLHLQKRNLKNDELLKGGSKTANVVKRKFNTTTWTDSLVLVVVFGVIFS